MRATGGCRTTTMALALGTALAITLAIPQASAAEADRAMKWQFSVPMTFTSGGSYTSENSAVHVDDDLGWGFTFGYHLNPKIMLGMDFTWLNANYDASIAFDNDSDHIPDTVVDIGGTLDAANLQFVGQYNFLTRKFTPFVRASLGWAWIDSNIPSGPAQGVCWWDPWWGYICDAWQPTFEDSSFAYGVGAGVRADLTDRFFVEGSYNVMWLDFDKAGTQDFDGFRLNLGWTF